MDPIFDWEFYLKINKDIFNSGIKTEEAALEHWNKYGKAEGRLAAPIVYGTPPEDFDWRFYTLKYKDLKNVGINTEQKAWEHWVMYGKKENRVYKYTFNTPRNRKAEFVKKLLKINCE